MTYIVSSGALNSTHYYYYYIRNFNAIDRGGDGVLLATEGLF